LTITPFSGYHEGELFLLLPLLVMPVTGAAFLLRRFIGFAPFYFCDCSKYGVGLLWNNSVA
jgi:hypothetical protein